MSFVDRHRRCVGLTDFRARSKVRTVEPVWPSGKALGW